MDPATMSHGRWEQVQVQESLETAREANEGQGPEV